MKNLFQQCLFDLPKDTSDIHAVPKCRSKVRNVLPVVVYFHTYNVFSLFCLFVHMLSLFVVGYLM